MVYIGDLKSPVRKSMPVRVRLRAPYRFRIMDNTKSFYLLNMGSIPVGGATFYHKYLPWLTTIKQFAHWRGTDYISI